MDSVLISGMLLLTTTMATRISNSTQTPPHLDSSWYNEQEIGNLSDVPSQNRYLAVKVFRDGPHDEGLNEIDNAGEASVGRRGNRPQPAINASGIVFRSIITCMRRLCGMCRKLHVIPSKKSDRCPLSKLKDCWKSFDSVANRQIPDHSIAGLSNWIEENKSKFQMRSNLMPYPSGQHTRVKRSNRNSKHTLNMRQPFQTQKFPHSRISDDTGKRRPSTFKTLDRTESSLVRLIKMQNVLNNIPHTQSPSLSSAGDLGLLNLKKIEMSQAKKSLEKTDMNVDNSRHKKLNISRMQGSSSPTITVEELLKMISYKHDTASGNHLLIKDTIYSDEIEKSKISSTHINEFDLIVNDDIWKRLNWPSSTITNQSNDEHDSNSLFLSSHSDKPIEKIEPDIPLAKTESKRVINSGDISLLYTPTEDCQHMFYFQVLALPGCVPKSVLLKRCLGACHSWSVPQWDSENQQIRQVEHCNCCKPFEMKVKTIQFVCPRRPRRRIAFSMRFPNRCECRPCATVPDVQAQQPYDYD